MSTHLGEVVMARWISRTLPHWDQLVCPECQYGLDIQEDDIREGEIVSCGNCGSQFEVMTHPFELRRIEDERPDPHPFRPAA
jgi:alpha-aminoadipate/glutamate carrier protein LysW